MIHLRNILFLIVLSAVYFFVNLGLFEPDLMEARNFVTAREMITNDNWLIPTMNDELRLEKQPFVTWLTAWSALAGNSVTNLFIMRLPSAIIATFMVLFFYGLCFELTRQKSFALMGGVIFAGSMLVVQMARVNSWDIFTHAFMVGSVWMQVKALQKPENNIQEWLFAGLFMSLSVFSKGPVSLYALWIPFMLSYWFFANSRHIRRNIGKITAMLVLSLLVGFAWNIYLYLEIPDKLTEVLTKEAVSRGTRHVRPFYFYFHFPVYIGIWAIPLLASLFFKNMRRRINEAGNFRFLLAWLLIGLFLLSVIPEKKERYMLPLEIPMSLMVAYLMHEIFLTARSGISDKGAGKLLRIHGGVVTLILIALPVCSFVVLKSGFHSPKYYAGALIAITTAFILLRELRKLNSISSVKVVFASTALTVALITAIYLPVLSGLIYKSDFRDVATVGSIGEAGNAKYISAGELNMELIWRIGRPVKPVDPGNFEFSGKGNYVFFSYAPAESFFIDRQLEKIDIQKLGTFDCNQDIKSNCEIHVYIIKNKI